jgi:putative oxidoreductase
MAARHREGSSIRNAIQSAKAALRAAEWMPMTAARVLIGIFFCISGGTKLLVPAQFTLMEQTLAQSHIPFPHANALFVSLVEFACGGGLALGLLTPVCALMLVVDMIVAIMTNRIQSIQARGVVAWLDDFLYLPEVLYVMLLVWLIFSGPGRYSIDGLIARRAGVAGVEREPRAAA